MDTLAFWLPLALLFFSALAGTALKRRARDHCLKKFQVLFMSLSVRDIQIHMEPGKVPQSLPHLEQHVHYDLPL